MVPNAQEETSHKANDDLSQGWMHGRAVGNKEEGSMERPSKVEPLPSPPLLVVIELVKFSERNQMSKAQGTNGMNCETHLE